MGALVSNSRDYDSPESYINISNTKQQPEQGSLMSPQMLSKYKNYILNANAAPSDSSLSAAVRGQYLTSPYGSQVMVDPSVTANLGNNSLLTMTGNYSSNPGDIGATIDYESDNGLSGRIQGSKNRQSGSVGFPSMGGKLNAEIERMSANGMPSEVIARLRYKARLNDLAKAIKSTGRK